MNCYYDFYIIFRSFLFFFYEGIVELLGGWVVLCVVCFISFIVRGRGRMGDGGGSMFCREVEFLVRLVGE